MSINPLYAEIGRRIASRRSFLGYSQARLANSTGLSRPSIANIEAGRQSVLVHHIYEIAAALLCAPGDLAPKPKLSSRDVIVLSPRGVSHIGDGQDKAREKHLRRCERAINQ